MKIPWIVMAVLPLACAAEGQEVTITDGDVFYRSSVAGISERVTSTGSP